MSAIAIVFAVNLLTSLIKRWVVPNWGSFGVQAVAFGLAVIGALYYTYAEQIPGLTAVVSVAIGIFSLSVTFYEVILQRIGFFKGEEEQA